ncbi:MAG: DUF3089 domain-containing protein [Acidimicrobiales bacterium]
MVAVLLGLVALGSFPTAASASLSTSANGVARTDAAGTVWLCRPGLSDDPCAGNLSTTVVTASNKRTVKHAVATGNSKFDCFYLYPTASPEETVNSDLTVQPAEISNAMAQTAPFSDVCDVWAPMYRQITVHALFGGGGASPDAGNIAYASVLSAWKDFLAHYDKGHPIILISHSQGSVMMIRLLQSQVDDDASLRHKVVVAIIAGGNVTVPDGKEVGVTFQHLQVCTKADQTSCVIAFSSFPSEPPANSMFGRAGQGISLNYGQTQTTGVHVVCVNPASIGGGTGELASSFPLAAVQPLPAQVLPPPAVTTPWVTYPDMYSASCESTDGATWLQVTHNAPAGDVRPLPAEPLGPTFGYHLDDINLSMGNLVSDVRAEEAAYKG